MLPDSFPPKEGAHSSITSHLDTLDRAREYISTPPDELKAAARELLERTFEGLPASPTTTFAPAAISLISDHTHYANGFALLMPVPQGTAVALRRTDRGVVRIAFEDDGMSYQLDDDVEMPVWARVAKQAITEVAGPDVSADAAVVSTVPSSSFDAYFATLAVATARAVMTSEAGVQEAGTQEKGLMPRLPVLRQGIAACTGLPFSVAFLIGASAARLTDPFTLVDTATREHLSVETTAREALSWVLMDPRVAPRDSTFHRHRRDQADEAIAMLQNRAFTDLRSFRELEHQDIPRAMDALPPRLTPVVRHLVTDNRRVQKMVAAMRRSDWQMVGALLLMSHASRRGEWKGTSAEADFLVEQVEGMTLEGIYGACMTGRGGSVVLVGQSHALPLGLERLTSAFEERFGHPLRTMSL